jgi:nucleoside-diphosphate-sugar epimerase
MIGRVVVYGGRGAMGSAVVTKFKESGWWVANVDKKTSELADENILVEGETWVLQVGEHHENSLKLFGDGVGGAYVEKCWICVGWREA